MGLGSEPKDRGSASLEFIAVGVLLLVPLVYVVIALGQIQGQAMGVEAASRHIARAISTAPGPEAGAARADAVLASVIDEYRLDAETVDIGIECTTGGACPQAGAIVAVRVAARVTLPLVPALFGLDRLASVPVEATTTQQVSRLWNAS